MPLKIIVIIPALNEEKTIGKVIQKASEYADEIIVINDGSADATEAVSKKAGAVVLNNIVTKGLGKTIRRGYAEALERGADIVVQIDADGQYAESDIPKLIRPILDNRADLVLGSRFAGGIEAMPFSKKLGNQISTLVTGLVAGVSITDSTTGFRATRREVLEEIQPANEFTYTQEMIIRIAKEGWRIMEVPTYFKRRASGDSRLFSSVLTYARNASLIVLTTYRDYHPLKFFAYPGLFLFLLGILFGVIVTYNHFMAVDQSASLLPILSALLIIAGLLMGSMGLLADMQEKKYRQLRRELKRLQK